MFKKHITNIILKKSNSYNFYKTKYEQSLENDSQYKKSIKVLEEENKRLKQRITSNKELDNKIRVLTNENNSLKKNMNSFNQIKDRLEKVHKQNSQTLTELKAVKQEKSLLKNELININNSNKQLTNKIEELNKTNQELLKNNKTNQELLKISNENKEELLITQKHAEYTNIKIESKYNQMERLLNSELSQHNQYIMTIIIPIYNSSDYIEQCFLSILKQSIFNKIEIIFVDDCSTDNSLEILYQLRKNYDNIRVFKTEENSGYAGKPRNIGLKYSSTDYVLFLDSDDTLCDGACQTLIEKIISTNADIVTGLHEEYYSKDIHVKKEIIMQRTFSDKSKTEEQREQEVEKLLKDNPEELIIRNIKEYPIILNTYALSSKIFNKTFLQENNITFPENISAQDSYFIFKSLLYSEKTVCIYNPIFIYDRTHYESVSHDSSQKNRLGRLKIYDMMYKLSSEMNLGQLFTEILLGQKMNYFLTSHLLNLNLSDNEFIEVFKNGRDLFKVLLEQNNVVTRGFNNLFTKIIEEDYEEAIKVSKSLKKDIPKLKLK